MKEILIWDQVGYLCFGVVVCPMCAVCGEPITMLPKSGGSKKGTRCPYMQKSPI